jgi:hypothetical protein
MGLLRPAVVTITHISFLWFSKSAGHRLDEGAYAR